MLKQEKSKGVENKQQVQQGVLQTLQNVSMEQQAGMVVGDVIRCTDDAKQRAEQCREMLPEVHTVTTARKVSVPLRVLGITHQK